MRPKPEQLWKRLLNEASPPAMSEAGDEDVSRIVSRLRWQPSNTAEPTMDSILWLLVSRFALPVAIALLIIATLLPSPTNTNPADSVDALIAAATQLP